MTLGKVMNVSRQWKSPRTHKVNILVDVFDGNDLTDILRIVNEHYQRSLNVAAQEPIEEVA